MSGKVQESESDLVLRVIGNYLEWKNHEYGTTRVYPKEKVREYFEMENSLCCDGAAEVLSSPSELPLETNIRFDFFAIKKPDYDQPHTRRRSGLDIGQFYIEATYEHLRDRVKLRQGVCFIQWNIRLVGYRIVQNRLHRVIGVRNLESSPINLQNGRSLLVFKYDTAFQILR